MQNNFITQSFGRAALVALLVAPALGAQGRWDDRDQVQTRARVSDSERRLFTWRGTVDGDTRIVIQGSNVQSRSSIWTRVARRENSQVDRDNALPRREGIVRVELMQGRGEVYVVQQPSARNDYTAILQVKDMQQGRGRYRFTVYFDPTDRGRRADRNDGRVWDDVTGDVYSGSPAMHWAGSVDGELRITMRRGQLNYNVLYGQEPQITSVSVEGQSPRRDAHLTLSLRQGRGLVSVIQQPSVSNDYTTIIRVSDNQAGYGYYDFDLLWQ